MKKIVCFILCTILLFSVGCMKIPTIDESFRYDPTNVNYNMSGNLTVWWAPMDFMWNPMVRAVEKFNKKFPNVKVNLVKKTRADYFDELNLTYTSNTTPDIVRLDHVYVQSLGESKRAVDLNLMTDGKFAQMEKDKFVGQTWDGMRIGDKQYGFPFESNTTLFMYNEKICKEVFGSNYKPPKNYDELAEQSKAVNNFTVEGQKPYKGFIMPINASNSQHDIYVLNGWLARFGASILNENRSNCVVNSSEGIDAFAKMKKMIDDKVVTHIGYAPTLENQFLYDGTVAFIEMGSWIYNDVKDMDLDEDGKSDIKIAPIPVLKQGYPGYATLGLSGLTMTSACKNSNKPAAYELMKFLSTDYETHMDFVTNMNVFPSLKEGLNDNYYNTGNQDWIDYWDIFEAQLLESVPRPGTKYWPEIVTKLKRAEMNLTLGGAYTPEKVANDTAKEINKILAGQR